MNTDFFVKGTPLYDLGIKTQRDFDECISRRHEIYDAWFTFIATQEFDWLAK